MITLEDFKNMTDTEKCAFINKHMETHNTKTFKDEEVCFSWSQAKKLLDVPTITSVDGKYMPSNEVAEYMEQKEKQCRPQPELSTTDIEKIKGLLENDGLNQLIELSADKATFDKLLKLASKYDYVSSYILSMDTQIELKRATGAMKSTSMRIPEKTLEAWQAFTKATGCKSTDLFNTALIDLMNRYGYGKDL